MALTKKYTISQGCKILTFSKITLPVINVVDRIIAPSIDPNGVDKTNSKDQASALPPGTPTSSKK